LRPSGKFPHGSKLFYQVFPKKRSSFREKWSGKIIVMKTVAASEGGSDSRKWKTQFVWWRVYSPLF